MKNIFILPILLLSFSALAAPQLDKPLPVPKKITGGNADAKKGGKLIYEGYEPDNFNPITYNQAGSIEIIDNWLFESLLDQDVVTGENIPRLAKAWAISKDKQTFTFWLNEKAKWFDGKPVTTDDVKFSFEVFSMPGVNAPFRKVAASVIDKIDIPAPGVITFHTTNKLFGNFGFLAKTIILPKHLYYFTDAKKMSENPYLKLPRGSGPYIIESWNKGDTSILKKNPNYWGKDLPQNKGAYNFDEIHVKYVRDPQIAFEKMKKGDLDYMPIRIGNTEIWKRTKEDKAFTEGKMLALAINNRLQEGYGFIGFNLRNDLFKDKKVRKALAKAVNREEIIQKSLAGQARIPKGPLYSVTNFSGKFEPVKYDRSAALKDLAEAGWKDSDGDYILDKGGKKFSFTVLVPNARIEKEMLFIQNYWKEIGVQMQIKILEYSTWRELQDERKFDALANGKMRTLNPTSVDPFGEWHSSNTPPGLSNFYGYINPEVDKLIENGRQEFDNAKRKKIFDKVNDIIAEEYVSFQYSESIASFHTVSTKIVTPVYQGKQWFPYLIGLKYWYKK